MGVPIDRVVCRQRGANFISLRKSVQQLHVQVEMPAKQVFTQLISVRPATNSLQKENRELENTLHAI